MKLQLDVHEDADTASEGADFHYSIEIDTSQVLPYTVVDGAIAVMKEWYEERRKSLTPEP